MAVRPDFLVIGAARSGTTALYLYLKQHPQIFMPEQKEPNFFAFEPEDLDFQGPGADWVNNSVTRPEDYDALFARAAGFAARGEASPLYLYSEKAPARIKAALPAARLIAILRDPAEQAYSHFLYARKNMIEPLEDFAEAIGQEEARLAQRWQPLFGYSSFPRYGEQIARYLEHFDRSQIKLFLYEEFDADPLRVLAEIFAFLDVDTGFTPDVSYRPNAGGAPKNKLLQSALMRPHLATRIAGALLPPDLRRRVKDRLSGGNTEKDPLPPRAKAMLRTRQREDTLRLQDLIGRDLSAWLR